MAWTVCFALAVGVLFASVYKVISQNRHRKKQKARFNGLNLLLAAFLFSSVLLSYPAFYETHMGETADIIKAIVFSFRKAIRLAGADEIYVEVFKHIHKLPALFANAYVILVLAVQFVTPLLSFGFVLSFFKNATAYLLFARIYFRDVYAFAELNEKSIALARDLMNSHKDSRIIFADVDEKDPKLSDLVWEAKELGAVIFKKDITTINFGYHSEKSVITFFAMCDDEMTNVEHSLKLISRYNSRKNTNLYLFSTGIESELLLASKEKGMMKVRRVDEVRSLILSYLYTDGDKIFKGALPLEDGTKQISAVIVGMGKRGTEMIKALVWYCQMNGYSIKINAFDSDALAEERFSALCPELMSSAYNGVYVEGEAQYKINVHSGYDVNTKRFAERFSAINDATFVFISLGSEEANIETSVQLRMLCERNRIKPIINAVIESSDAKKALQGAKNSAGQYYGINFVGDVEALYSEQVVVDSALENDAFARHCLYCNGDTDKEEDFWRYEYCYRSSMATAIHAQARIKCGIPGAGKSESELTDSERDILETLEHKRWNAYMRAEGYVYSGSPDRGSRNDLAKMHNNLVVYSLLDEEDKRKDSRVAVSTEEDDNG